LLQSVRRLKTIFVVDDDPGVRTLMERVLGSRCRVRSFESGSSALNALQSVKPDVLLTDLQLPDLSGEDLALAMRLLRRPVRVIFMSGSAERLATARFLADATVPEPFPMHVLEAALEDPEDA